jgi:hypothetical protein
MLTSKWGPFQVLVMQELPNGGACYRKEQPVFDTMPEALDWVKSLKNVVHVNIEEFELEDEEEEDD